MKKVFFLKRLILSLFLVSIFASCDKDDAETEKIIGSWKPISLYVFVSLNGETTHQGINLSDDNTLIIFQSDRRLIEYSVDKNEATFQGVYTVTGSTLIVDEYSTFFCGGGRGKTNLFFIKELTSDKLVLHSNWKDAGVDYQTEITLKKAR